MNAITLTATLLLGLSYASVGLAAHNTYVFFDWQNCRGHAAQNDPLTGNKVYEEWQGKAKQLSVVDIEKAQGEWSDGTWADFNSVSRPKLVVGENTFVGF